MTADTASPKRRAAARFLATFGYAWLMIGLFTGTIVLVLFVRGIVGALHRFGFGPDAENRVLIAVILAFIVGSFLLTRSVVRRVYRTPSVRARRLALGALVLPGIASMWAWSNPTALLAHFAGSSGGMLSVAGGPEFVFGPYPQPERLAELKREGYTAVISLQHPSVVVELSGILKEREAASRLGIELIQAPMLPWVSDNRASLEKIREIVRTGRGRYYVHCGLGRDRVNVVKRVIASMASERGARLARGDGLLEAKGLEQRAQPFQHGPLFRLRDSTWLTPIPNRMELSEILFGAEGKVLLVLDPGDAAQQSWSSEAQREMRDYLVPFRVVPFTERDAGDTARVQALAMQIMRESGRVTVVVPRTPFGNGAEPNTAVARALLRVFR
jgi:hypothetical protein